MPAPRSTLPKEAARRRYVELAGLVVLEQIREDSERLDAKRCRSGRSPGSTPTAVAAREGKTRGAISNLFGSQAALQAETMALALDAAQLTEATAYPAPEDHDDADAWVDAFFADQSARGPRTRRAGGRLRHAVGALALRRALRAVERARRGPEHRRAPAVDRAARDGPRGARSATSACASARA